MIKSVALSFNPTSLKLRQTKKITLPMKAFVVNYLDSQYSFRCQTNFEGKNKLLLCANDRISLSQSQSFRKPSRDILNLSMLEDNVMRKSVQVILPLMMFLVSPDCALSEYWSPNLQVPVTSTVSVEGTYGPNKDEVKTINVLPDDVMNQIKQSRGVFGEITLGKSVRHPSSPAVLFIAIREKNGRGPPIAARKYVEYSFPMKYSIGKSNFLPGNVAFPPEIEVSVTLDSDGDPFTKSDQDLFGKRETKYPLDNILGLNIVLEVR